MSTVVESTLNRIDALIQSRHLLDHPFYQTWTRGELTLDALRDYTSQYYQHVDAFPRYLSTLHSITEDAEARRHILQNLVDEEAGHPNHPELWLQFANSLDLEDASVKTTPPEDETRSLIGHFLATCEKSTAEGLGALYAYESQIPAVSETKIDGLKKYYGMDDPKGYDYFTVHMEADVEHSRVERELLAQFVTSENEDEVLLAVEGTLDSLYTLLDGVCVRHGIAC